MDGWREKEELAASERASGGGVGGGADWMGRWVCG